MYNFGSAAFAIVGTVIGLVLGAKSQAFVHFILPIAAGGFVYIAGSNLIPELHKDCELTNSFWHFVAMVVGIALMVALVFIG
jgi:zinc and cadmium transporter